MHLGQFGSLQGWLRGCPGAEGGVPPGGERLIAPGDPPPALNPPASSYLLSSFYLSFSWLILILIIRNPDPAPEDLPEVILPPWVIQLPCVLFLPSAVLKFRVISQVVKIPHLAELVLK